MILTTEEKKWLIWSLAAIRALELSYPCNFLEAKLAFSMYLDLFNSYYALEMSPVMAAEIVLRDFPKEKCG